MPRGLGELSEALPGNTSISLQIQSASVPVVETHSDATIGPATVRSSESGSDSYTTTSGRTAAKRWSSTIQRCPCVVRVSALNGTGLAGSLVNESAATPESRGD